MRISDWSSDVCSSDLAAGRRTGEGRGMARGGAALSVGASGARYAGDGGAAFSPAGPEGTGDPASIRPACADACRKCGTSPTRLPPTPSTVVLCKSSCPPRPLALVAVQHQISEEHTSELQSLMRISYA